MRQTVGVSSAIDQTFAPAGATWSRVSTKLTKARRISLSLVYLLVIAGVIVLFAIPTIPRWIPIATAGVAVVVYVWLFWFLARRTKSWGYAEREDDLLVTRGFMFKRLVIVPYGRMQLVDLKAGPIDRAMGIATLQLHTAAATSDAVIPGLPPDVAAALRDRLAALGEQRAAGL